MRRVVFVLAVALALIVAPIQPILFAQVSLIQVTLTCSDGIQLFAATLSVDTATLTALQSAVEAMTLYPAGQVCQLTQQVTPSLGALLFAPLLAFAQNNPNKDFVVGGGRIDDCLNFSVSGHSDAVNSADSTYGSITETIPQDVGSGMCPSRGHYKAQVVCLSVSNNIAFLAANYLESSGFFADFGHVVAAFADNGNPASGPPPDLVAFRNLPGPASETPESLCGARVIELFPTTPLSNGNVVVNDAP
jgi:hypothetical protein